MKPAHEPYETRWHLRMANGDDVRVLKPSSLSALEVAGEVEDELGDLVAWLEIDNTRMRALREKL